MRGDRRFSKNARAIRGVGSGNTLTKLSLVDEGWFRGIKCQADRVLSKTESNPGQLRYLYCSEFCFSVARCAYKIISDSTYDRLTQNGRKDYLHCML